MKCSGHSKRSGAPCKKDAMIGKSVCHMHGGKSYAGAASPTFKHGMDSAILRELNLGRRYEERITDPELHRLRHYLAFLDARNDQLLGELARGSLPTPEAMQEQIAACRAAIEVGDWNQMNDAVKGLQELVDKRAGDAVLWREVYKVVDLRRKASAAESLTLDRLNQTMTAEQVSALNLAVYQAVNAAVLSLVQEFGIDPKYHRNVMDSIGIALRRLLSQSATPDVLLN